jgi:class 3 adenylate cyclase
VSGQRREFIVLAMGDRESQGHDEAAQLRLFQLIDSSAPDSCISSRIGIVGFYVRSARSVAAVEQVISDAEKLRDSNKAFATLGIGLADGPLIADFHVDGSVNTAFTPVGEVANQASRAVHGAQNYRERLSDLYQTQNK